MGLVKRDVSHTITRFFIIMLSCIFFALLALRKQHVLFQVRVLSFVYLSSREWEGPVSGYMVSSQHGPDLQTEPARRLVIQRLVLHLDAPNEPVWVLGTLSVQCGARGHVSRWGIMSYVASGHCVHCAACDPAPPRPVVGVSSWGIWVLPAGTVMFIN